MNNINKSETRHLAVSPDQAAAMLGIGRNLVYKMIKTGEIQAIRLGERRLLIPIVGLNRLLEGK